MPSDSTAVPPAQTTSIFLPDSTATLALGALSAQALPKNFPGQRLLLQGDLGAGKTTFVRGLIQALPNGHLAEVSSPSFNVVNYYPTVPPTAHFDLYRLSSPNPDESLLECLDSENTLIIIEWIDHLSKRYWPEDYLLFSWGPSEQGRSLRLECRGTKASHYFHNLQPGLSAAFKES